MKHLFRGTKNEYFAPQYTHSILIVYLKAFKMLIWGKKSADDKNKTAKLSSMQRDNSQKWMLQGNGKYLLFWTNTKYISSSVVEKVFTTENNRWFIFGICPKKVNFLFTLYSNDKKQKIFPGRFSSEFSLSVFIEYNMECKHGLHLENCLKLHFN